MVSLIILIQIECYFRVQCRTTLGDLAPYSARGAACLVQRRRVWRSEVGAGRVPFSSVESKRPYFTSRGGSKRASHSSRLCWRGEAETPAGGGGEG